LNADHSYCCVCFVLLSYGLFPCLPAVTLKLPWRKQGLGDQMKGVVRCWAAALASQRPLVFVHGKSRSSWVWKDEALVAPPAWLKGALRYQVGHTGGGAAAALARCADASRSTATTTTTSPNRQPFVTHLLSRPWLLSATVGVRGPGVGRWRGGDRAGLQW